MEKMSLNEPLNDLNALNKHLLEKIAQLEAENADLRRRLGLDRTNSHKPPSSDGYLMKPGFASKENCAGCTPRPSYTPLFIHENRGAKALESDASVLKNFKGTAVHDG